MEFIDAYSNHESPIYKSLTKVLENEIKKSMASDLNMLDDVNVKIMNLTYVCNKMVIEYAWNHLKMLQIWFSNSWLSFKLGR